MPTIDVKLDVTALVAWADDLRKSRIRSVIASSINRAARAARKQAIVTIAADIGVPLSRVKKSVSTIVRASPNNLRASFTASKSRIGIKNTAGFTYAKGQGILAATDVLTGGGSANLHAAKAFKMTAGGNTFIVIRKGKGRQDIKAIYAEGVNTAMAQPTAAARIGWQRDATSLSTREVSAGVQAALLQKAAISDAGSDD